MADEELHEIQLNGKQLVFLFMAGTVAAVVIFLCGLMVGRNLRSPKPEAITATTETASVDPTRTTDSVPPPPTPATEGSKPVSTGEDLTYASRLEAPTPVEEHLRDADAPPVDPTRPEPTAKKTPVETSAAPAPTPAPAVTPPAAAASSGEPAGNGWAVQVQAVTKRDAADAIAKRLLAKGYPSFVTTSGSNPTFYRIRVGKYPDKRDAEAIKAKLEKEEQFHPILAR